MSGHQKKSSFLRFLHFLKIKKIRNFKKRDFSPQFSTLKICSWRTSEACGTENVLTWNFWAVKFAEIALKNPKKVATGLGRTEPNFWAFFWTFFLEFFFHFFFPTIKACGPWNFGQNPAKKICTLFEIQSTTIFEYLFLRFSRFWIFRNFFNRIFAHFLIFEIFCC